jgi:ATP-dependent Lhr-like helicase
MFLSGGGEVHSRVSEKMRDVLAAIDEYSYLDPVAQSLMRIGRDRCSGLARRAVMSLGSQRTRLLTWTGTRIQLTLAAAIEIKKLRVEVGPIALHVDAPIAEVRAALESLLSRDVDARALASVCAAARERKYDRYLSSEIRTESISRDFVDIDGARAVVRVLLT